MTQSSVNQERHIDVQTSRLGQVQCSSLTDSNTANNTANVALAAPVPPLFHGEQRVYSGKGKHKKLVVFEYLFNGALNAGSAQSRGDYHVTVKNGKKLKVLAVKGVIYNSGNFSVTISVAGFSIGKKTNITITGLLGANGAVIAQILSKL